MTEKLTAQEVFDKVSTHLLTQNAQAQTLFEGNINCVYRNPQGLMCAVGCLISDADYNKSDMEYNTVNQLFKKYNHLPSIEQILEHLTMLNELQDLHDSIVPKRWKYRLRGIANTYSLNESVLEQFPD